MQTHSKVGQVTLNLKNAAHCNPKQLLQLKTVAHSCENGLKVLNQMSYPPKSGSYVESIAIRLLTLLMTFLNKQVKSEKNQFFCFYLCVTKQLVETCVF